MEELTPGDCRRSCRIARGYGSGVFGAMGGGFALSVLLKMLCWVRIPIACALGDLQSRSQLPVPMFLINWALSQFQIPFTYLLQLRSLHLLWGGSIFGLGMAFVGTCGFGTLARMGGGDLKSVVTFLVMGISAYATLRGLTAYVRVALFSQPEPATELASFAALIERNFGIQSATTAYSVAVVLTIICFASPKFRSDWKRISIGILVGLVVVWGWYSTGVLAADDFEPYLLESYTFSAPLGETIVYAMTASGSALRFGIGATVGVVLGAFLTTLALGHFRWEAADDAREMKRQIFGGFLMGLGSVTALGCTIGQGISAASTLAYSTPVVLTSIFIGAWLGLQYLIHGSFKEPLWHLFSRQ